MAARRVQADWSGRHGPVHAVVNGGLWAAMAAGIAQIPRFQPVWALAAAALIGLATLIHGAVHDLVRRTIAYRVVCCVAAGVWATWALATGGLWHPAPWAVLAVLVAVGAIIGAAIGRAEKRDREAAAARLAAKLATTGDQRSRKAAEWTTRIARVCNVTVEDVLGVKMWPDDAGFTLDLQMPLGGWSWHSLKRYETELASDARLPEGCGVEIRPGTNRSRVLVDVSTRNAIVETFPYPTDHPMRTVNNPLTWARYRNASPMEVPIRQKSVLVTGDTGSGKTTTLDTIIASLLECVDVIPLVIDFNGGGLALPWLLAWRQNQDKVQRSPIYWVATDPAEALRMTDWLIRVAEDRKSTFMHLKVARNTTLLPMSPDLPFYALIVDEFAEVSDNGFKDPIRRRVLDNVEKIQRIARDSGARLILSSLTATNDTLGTRTLRTLCAVRLALQADSTELYYNLGESKLDPAEAPYPGSGFSRIDKNPVRTFKTLYTDPKARTQIVIATDGRRPGPDPRSIELGGTDLAQRWDRATDLLDTLDAGAEAVEAILRGEPAAPIATSPVHSSTTGTPGPTKETPMRDQSPPNLTESVNRMKASREEMLRAADAADARREQAANDTAARRHLEAELAEIAPGIALPDAPEPGRPTTDTPPPAIEPPATPPAQPAQGAARPGARDRYRQIITAAKDPTGPTEISRQLKAEGYGTVRQTVSGWLDDDVIAGLVERRDNQYVWVGPR